MYKYESVKEGMSVSRLKCSYEWTKECLILCANVSVTFLYSPCIVYPPMSWCLLWSPSFTCPHSLTYSSYPFLFLQVPLIPSHPILCPSQPIILPYPWVLFRTLKFLQKRIIDKQFIFYHPSDHDSYIPIKNPFHQFSCPLHYHSGGLELKNLVFQSIRKWCTNLKM